MSTCVDVGWSKVYCWGWRHCITFVALQKYLRRPVWDQTCQMKMMLLNEFKKSSPSRAPGRDGVTACWLFRNRSEDDTEWVCLRQREYSFWGLVSPSVMKHWHGRSFRYVSAYRAINPELIPLFTQQMVTRPLRFTTNGIHETPQVTWCTLQRIWKCHSLWLLMLHLRREQIYITLVRLLSRRE